MIADFKGVSVTPQDILVAMKNFDIEYSHTNEYDAWLDKCTYKYAIKHGSKLYPCKHILSRATGISTLEFSGGEQTNRVFRQLNFIIIDKPRKA